MLDGVSVFVSTKISPTAGSSCLSASRSPAASDPRPRLSTQWPRAGLGSSTTRASTTGLLRALGSTGHRNSELRWFEDGLASAGQRPNGTVRKCLRGRRTAAWRRTETRHPREHCRCSTEPTLFASVMCDGCASTGCCVCGVGTSPPITSTVPVREGTLRTAYRTY